MAASRKIRVMISSRCHDRLGADGTTLTDVRRRIKAEVEGEQMFGEDLFEVWINEDAPSGPAVEDSWEHCMSQVADADIVVALYNGNSGWTRGKGEIGICHGEMERALDTAPGKLRVVEIEPLVWGEDRARDERFRAYVGVRTPFWRGVKTADDAVKATKAAIRAAVGEMVGWGVREARKGKYATGTALDWTRLDFAARKQAMEAVVTGALLERGAKPEQDDVLLRLRGTDVQVICSAIPAALGVAPARELVGRPHLRDHLSHAGSKGTGPVHLIACHRGVTENQASAILGYPDATIVTAPFGVYVADDVQKVQLVFLRDCRDPTTTTIALQRFFEWLLQAEEEARLVARAGARARIVDAIVKELT